MKINREETEAGRENEKKERKWSREEVEGMDRVSRKHDGIKS